MRTIIGVVFQDQSPCRSFGHCRSIPLSAEDQTEFRVVRDPLSSRYPSVRAPSSPATAKERAAPETPARSGPQVPPRQGRNHGPPHHFHPTIDKRGYVLNLLVEPAYRKRGLASKLMRLAEIEFANRGVGFAVLHASAKGMPLYSELGWTRTSEMSKPIEKVQDTASFESVAHPYIWP